MSALKSYAVRHAQSSFMTHSYWYLPLALVLSVHAVSPLPAAHFLWREYLQCPQGACVWHAEWQLVRPLHHASLAHHTKYPPAAKLLHTGCQVFGWDTGQKQGFLYSRSFSSEHPDIKSQSIVCLYFTTMEWPLPRRMAFPIVFWDVEDFCAVWCILIPTIFEIGPTVIQTCYAPLLLESWTLVPVPTNSGWTIKPSACIKKLLVWGSHKY